MNRDLEYWKERAEKLEAQNRKLRIIVDRLRPLHSENQKLRDELKLLKSQSIGKTAPAAPVAAVPKKSLPATPTLPERKTIPTKSGMLVIDDESSTEEADDNASFELVAVDDGAATTGGVIREHRVAGGNSAPRSSWLSTINPEELRQRMLTRFGDKDLGEDDGDVAIKKSPRAPMGITSGGIPAPADDGASGKPRRSTLVLNKEEEKFLQSSGPHFEEEVEPKGGSRKNTRKGLGFLFASRGGADNPTPASLRKTTSPRRSPRSMSGLRKNPRSDSEPAMVDADLKQLAANLMNPPALDASLSSKHAAVVHDHTSSVERLSTGAGRPDSGSQKTKKSWGRKKGSAISASRGLEDLEANEAVNVMSPSLMPAEMSRKWSTEMALQVENTGSSDLKLKVINALTLRKTIYYMLRVDCRESSWVVPRTAEQFKEFHSLLKFKYLEDVPEFNLPVKLFKKVQEKTVRDRIGFLEGFLDELLVRPALVGSTELIQFMDPFYRPSPIALRAIQPSFEGALMLKTDKSVKSFRQFWFILKHDLYCFKSLDDEMPHDVISLEYTTIDIVKDQDYPRFCFSLTSLDDAETYYLAAETNRNLADWILALRTVKSQRNSYNVAATEPKKPKKRDSIVVKLNKTEALLNSYMDFLEGEHTDESEFGRVVENVPVPQNPTDPASVKIEENTKKHTRTILGSSKDRALYLVFDPSLTDVTWLRNFLCCFREWFEPAILFTVMSRTLVETDQVQVRQRIVYFLERWIIAHFYDFTTNILMCRRLVNFLHETLAVPRFSEAKQRLIKELRCRLVSDGKIRSGSIKSERAAAALLIRDAPQSILPPVFTSSCFDFMDLAPLEVARQLTILEHGFFAQLDAREFLCQRWVGDDRFRNAPHLTAAILRFNQVCGWVSSLIVSTAKIVPRIAILHRFIDIARCCMELENFNSVVAVMGGLQNNAVYRLRDTWESLPQDSRDAYEEMKALLNNSRNFQNYRQKFDSCTPPAVPYLGLLLTDLTFTEQGNPEYLDNHMINFKRVSQLGDIIAKIQRFQKKRYSLKPLPYVMEYLRKITPLDEEEQDRLSFLIRPRGGGNSSAQKVVWKEEFGLRNTPT